MHTTMSKVLVKAVLLLTIGIQSNFGISIAQNIEIHVTNDNTSIRKNKIIIIIRIKLLN